MTLTSDDLLLNDPTLGRCYLCHRLFGLHELVEVQRDEAVKQPEDWVNLCIECDEGEVNR